MEDGLSPPPGRAGLAPSAWPVVRLPGARALAEASVSIFFSVIMPFFSYFKNAGAARPDGPLNGQFLLLRRTEMYASSEKLTDQSIKPQTKVLCSVNQCLGPPSPPNQVLVEVPEGPKNLKNLKILRVIFAQGSCLF
jgi:hypothetical protein